MKWRPVSWKEKYQHKDFGRIFMKQRKWKHWEDASFHEIFESGANAMLEVLRKDGLQVDISAGVRVFTGGKQNLLYRTKGTPTGRGKLVFIPDEEEV
uniref:Uncharacterized protein n=1 Tax=viral metagenome TaxID=1070528 RepID=A0A6M3KZW6_9ZZZZ